MDERHGVGGSEMQRRCLHFSNWMEENGLLDLGFSGPSHTWFRGDSANTFKSARLDRFIANDEWRLKFDEGAVKHLPKACSDHCPIVLSTNGFAPIPMICRPFRFQAAWLTHEKFDEFVRANWDNSRPLIPFLLSFADKLNKWNKEIFHNIFHKKANLWARLEGVQRGLAVRRLDHLISREKALRQEMELVLQQEELLWFQKSRLEAIRDGDRNTKFFHLSTVIRRRRNRIEMLQNSDGVWLLEPQAVKNLVVEYWKGLFREDSQNAQTDPFIINCFPTIPPTDWANLTKPYAACEVQAAIMSMKPYKAPGPDGFQPVFYQHYWNLLAPSVTRTVLDILEGRHFPEDLNKAFLVLIPKEQTPQFVTQFRPIGLCNIVYKAATKVLVNRLKHMLPTVISPTQCSFVPRRQITNNIIIVQEMLHTMRKKQGRTGFMAIKIDFEKAYDRLRWSFIRQSLLELRLPQVMVEVIMQCVTSAKLQILWNGEPTESFSPSRGIRQGDPLSPYLYVICMERLAHLIEKAVDLQVWRPVKASRNGPSISNLAFADDLILFAEATVDQAMIMYECLDQFCGASGSKISHAKSRVFFSSNTEAEIKKDICDALNITETDDLGVYLGVPTINGRSSKKEYQFLVDRINGKLAGWKSKMISMAGRATLVQSCLSPMPYYAMQTTKLPRSTCDEIDRISRRFLWGGSEEKKKIHLVSWDTITKPKQLGGLGIRSMRQANSAFLAKLGWRVLAEPEALWSRVLRSKYGDGRCDIDIFKPRHGESNAWRGIIDNVDILKRGMSRAVGNGQDTLFWRHSWATNVPLIDCVSLPPPTDMLDMAVKDMWDNNVGWKTDIFADYLPANILQIIESFELQEDPEAIDTVYWNGSASGGFTIKSALQLIRNDEEEDTPNPWKHIWKLKLPQRLRFFLWLVFRDRLMSNKNRVLRGLTQDASCKVCGALEEDVEHILRKCPAAISLWSKFPWIPNNEFLNQPFHMWLDSNLNENNQAWAENWYIVFANSLWWLWRWRNNKCFYPNPDIPMDQITFIMGQVGNITQAMRKVDLMMGKRKRQREEIYVRWIAPREGWVKLNTDGASKGNPGRAGCGGVIRGNGGEIFDVYASNCGTCSSTKAELLGVVRGLAIAWNAGFKKVVLSVDSEVVVKLLMETNIPNSSSFHLINRCKSMIKRHGWEVRVGHCYREANRAADWLANYGVNMEQRILLFEAIPGDLRTILLEDLRGMTIARRVPAPAA
ncbi:uncharacterized protein [Spinacia oleracea]|uniref:Reverse transcriptase domain-containing protein n=1 Tax=Spinacia oleracea TaxID=3562 RepID=A0ABM3RPM0_SPIOL|nr:uncharacterized protein LOC130471461 [Spinacia oleracea]